MNKNKKKKTLEAEKKWESVVPLKKFETFYVFPSLFLIDHTVIGIHFHKLLAIEKMSSKNKSLRPVLSKELPKI